MIKQIFFSSFLCFIVIIASCDDREKSNEPTIEIPRLTLPLKIRAERFYQKSDSDNLSYLKESINDTLLFVGQIETNRFTIYLKKKQGEIGPIIYTTDKNSKVIDTLFLYEKTVYLGTDSYYLPWILINNKLEITRTDTSYYYQPMMSLPDGKDVSIRDTFIRTDRFQINKYGFITKK